MLLFGVEADLTTHDGIETARAAFATAFDGFDFDDEPRIFEELDDGNDSVYDCDDDPVETGQDSHGGAVDWNAPS